MAAKNIAIIKKEVLLKDTQATHQEAVTTKGIEIEDHQECTKEGIGESTTEEKDLEAIKGESTGIKIIQEMIDIKIEGTMIRSQEGTMTKGGTEISTIETNMATIQETIKETTIPIEAIKKGKELMKDHRLGQTNMKVLKKGTDILNKSIDIRKIQSDIRKMIDTKSEIGIQRKEITTNRVEGTQRMRDMAKRETAIQNRPRDRDTTNTAEKGNTKTTSEMATKDANNMSGRRWQQIVRIVSNTSKATNQDQVIPMTNLEYRPILGLKKDDLVKEYYVLFR